VLLLWLPSVNFRLFRLFQLYNCFCWHFGFEH